MTDRDKLEQAIAIQESLRGTMPDDLIDVAIAALRQQLAALEPSSVTEQRKQITLLVASLSGFAPMAEKIDVEEVGQIVNTLFAAITPAVRKHGGIIEKFIGDDMVAVFGLPQSRENDPANAVRAALAMQQALGELNETMKANRDLRLGMQIGINTGPVVARYLGGDPMRELTVVGSTVKLTAQLAMMAPEGGVLISHDTYGHVRGVFDVLQQASLQIDPEARPIGAYLVQQAKPRAFRLLTPSVAGIATRMVGRDAELLMLQNLFRDAMEDAEAHVVTVVGDAGLGKSRLLYEFEKWIELLPEEIWYFKGRATPETAAMPYRLIRRMFVHRFDILESDNAAEVRAKFRAGMAMTLDTDQADMVGQLLGLDFSDSQAVQLELGSHSFGDLATTYLTWYLSAVAAEPTVIFLEDIHWADDSSLDLLNRLVAALPETRLLVIGLARPSLFENRPNWGEGQEIHTQIMLRPLSRRASRALVEEILQKVEGVPHELRDLIVAGAEGNPFFVEELIKVLIEDGVIVYGDPQWQVELERLAEVRVPPTLAGVLQARLDSLPLEEKGLLQRAAVVGRRFWDAAVISLGDQKETRFSGETIASLLETLRDRELVFRREHSAFAGTEEYIFKHALLRDVTYDTVLLRERRTYHGKTARWLEEAAGKRLEEYLGLIAGHYELAGEEENAINYLLRAGDRARQAYACQEASGYYQRSLDLLEKRGELELAARTLMKLGLTYDLSFDIQGARQAYERGFALWQQLGSSQWNALSLTSRPLRIATENPTTLDPTIAEDSRSNTKIAELFSGLVEQRLDLEVVPDMAHSWEVLEGGKRYLFHLRDDIRWSDGRSVTAADFEFAWKRVLDPANEISLSSLLDDIKGARAFRRGQVADSNSVGVKALDNVTLMVDLEGPTGYFLQLLANTKTFPVPRHMVERYGTAWAEPENLVTCGPFQLQAWQPGERMSMVRNPNYPGRFRGNLERVELLLHDLDPAVILEMYEADQLDVASVTPFSTDRMLQKYAGEYRRFPQLDTTYLQFDLSRPPFDDVRVRQAFVLATDREALVKATRPDCFPSTGGLVPPGMAGHLPEIGMPCDLERARYLLAKAGYPAGQSFPEVECLTRADRYDLGENLGVQWLEHLGVKVTWKAVEWQVILGRLGNQVPHLLIMGWVADYPDPDNFLRASVDHIQRHSAWRNEAYDNLVRRAQRSLDQGHRIRLYEKAERILVEEAPIMPIFHRSARLLVKPWVTRFPTTGLREWFLKDVIIKPEA